MVKFPFKIGKAFLDYHWYPITIPKACYSQLEREELIEDSLSIVSCFGNTSGSIVHGMAGWGPFYQIKMLGGHSRDPMARFKLGQRLSVEIERVGKSVRVTLNAA